MTKGDLVMATHDGALALGAQAHGLRVMGSPDQSSYVAQ